MGLFGGQDPVKHQKKTAAKHEREQLFQRARDNEKAARRAKQQPPPKAKTEDQKNAQQAKRIKVADSKKKSNTHYTVDNIGKKRGEDKRKWFR